MNQTQAKMRIWAPQAYSAEEVREASAFILGSLDASQQDLDQASLVVAQPVVEAPRAYNVIEPSSCGKLGRVTRHRDGWRFLSNVSSHGNSRVARPTADGAIPRWAKKMGAKLV